MRVTKRSAGLSSGSAGVPIRNGLIAEYKFDECRNILKYSQQFDNSVWAKGDISVTSNAIIAPDGTSTADKLVEAATTAYHRIIYTIPTPNGVSEYTYSVYIKAGERTYVDLSTAVGITKHAYFDLTNGTVVTSPFARTSIQYVGNDWYRCSISDVFTGNSIYIYTMSNESTINYLGDGTSGLYVWGVQLEVGTAATTYVPTTDKQTLMDYSKPRKNLLLPNQANCCEDGTTLGIASWASTPVSASTTEALFGTYSVKSITPNVAASEGMYTSPYTLVKPNTTYTISCYVKGDSGTILMYCIPRDDTGTAISGTTNTDVITLDGTWQRISKSITMPETGRQLNMRVTTNIQQGITFYVDGIQLEEGTTATVWETPPNIGMIGSTWGSDTNDTTWTGEGAYFTTDDYIKLPAMLAGKTAATMIVVVNQITPVSGAGFLGSYVDSGAANYAFSIRDTSTTGIYTRVSDGTNECGNTTLTPVGATYQYITSRFIGGQSLINKIGNGANDYYTTSIPASLNADTTKGIIIGKGVGYLTGNVVYVAIYDRALSDAEIARNYVFIKSYLFKNRGIVVA